MRLRFCWPCCLLPAETPLLKTDQEYSKVVGLRLLENCAAVASYTYRCPKDRTPLLAAHCLLHNSLADYTILLLPTVNTIALTSATWVNNYLLLRKKIAVAAKREDCCCLRKLLHAAKKSRHLLLRRTAVEDQKSVAYYWGGAAWYRGGSWRCCCGRTQTKLLYTANPELLASLRSS